LIGLLQRVSRAEVYVAQESVGRIERGLLVLVGVQRTDDEARADRLLDRLLTYRVFPDPAGRMNLGLIEVGGALLLVPQFTLAADTRKGRRPGFSCAATPDQGRRLFDYLCGRACGRGVEVRSGRFGADMQVSLVNDGPVTFWLET
jgi:D-tyrosyl-tRNA(Tyr) deacylase